MQEAFWVEWSLFRLDMQSCNKQLITQLLHSAPGGQQLSDHHYFAFMLIVTIKSETTGTR